VVHCLSDEQYGFILLSDEKWWNRLCERCKGGKKTHAFVRRNLVGPKKAEKLLFYVKRPSMQIRGVADFIERVAGDPKELWEKYGGETCLNSYKEYLAFLKGREKATFIRFTNFCELENPVPFEVLKKLSGVLKVPRGGKYISREIVNQLIT
jgi:predicted transcriptional regulator